AKSVSEVNYRKGEQQIGIKRNAVCYCKMHTYTHNNACINSERNQPKCNKKRKEQTNQQRQHQRQNQCRRSKLSNGCRCAKFEIYQGFEQTVLIKHAPQFLVVLTCEIFYFKRRNENNLASALYNSAIELIVLIAQKLLIEK